MDNMLNSLIGGFEAYYNTITNIGHAKMDSINKLIIASWIYDVLNGKYGTLINKEEYSILNDLYMCIEGDCLVPYVNYCKDITVNKMSDSIYLKITEQNHNDRLLESNNGLRIS